MSPRDGAEDDAEVSPRLHKKGDRRSRASMKPGEERTKGLNLEDRSNTAGSSKKSKYVQLFFQN